MVLTLTGFELGHRARVDWWQVITDLERAAFPQARIAREIGRSVGWVDYVKNSPDADPKFRDAVHLLQLWVNTGREIAKVPYLEHSGISTRAR